MFSKNDFLKESKCINTFQYIYNIKDISEGKTLLIKNVGTVKIPIILLEKQLSLKTWKKSIHVKSNTTEKRISENCQKS